MSTTTLHRRLAALTVAGATGLALTVAGTPAEAAPARAGERSIAAVLAADGTKFDKKAGDLDILEAAVLAVLEADPESPVGLLADGSERATAFAPTDAAFRALVKDLTGKAPKKEAKVFSTLAELAGVETVEAVLLYHVVVGKTLRSGKVVAAAEDGAEIETAGGTVTLDLRKGEVVLMDADPDDRDPRAIGRLLDLNKGNRQVAHGIDRVLRPLDL